MPIREVNNENQFQTELVAAGRHLVVVDFYASWCGPCQIIAPHFELLPEVYPNVIFLRVDVDECAELAIDQELTAIPSFMFYRNKKKIDKIQGIDINALAEKISEYAGDSDETDELLEIAAKDDDEDHEDYGEGLMNLNNLISKDESACINESDDHPLSQCLTSKGGGYLQSDFDEQLIISITFKQAVKIQSLKFKAPMQMGPKNIKVFVNEPHMLDFIRAENKTSVQDLLLNARDLENGTPIKLPIVRFHNVRNIQLFVKNNQSGGVITQIDYMSFIGSPLKPIT
uniref:Thioredoxin domain-containing protein n=1 Tax=Glossina brevipalpis TaxID=37001 RepID=A0A1A9WEK5_9MUSC